MIESPLIWEIERRAERRARLHGIEVAIEARFAPLDKSSLDLLKSIFDDARLDRLIDYAVVCPSREAFVERLAHEVTADFHGAK